MSASSCCDSPAEARNTATAAARSARASASRIGGESHSQVGAPRSASAGVVRAARVHGAHSGSGLYRDSRGLRHGGHSRPCVMIILLTENFQAKHAGEVLAIPMCHHYATPADDTPGSN